MTFHKGSIQATLGAALLAYRLMSTQAMLDGANLGVGVHAPRASCGHETGAFPSAFCAAAQHGGNSNNTTTKKSLAFPFNVAGGSSRTQGSISDIGQSLPWTRVTRRL
jgi:hypothetical protein